MVKLLKVEIKLDHLHKGISKALLTFMNFDITNLQLLTRGICIGGRPASI